MANEPERIEDVLAEIRSLRGSHAIAAINSMFGFADRIEAALERERVMRSSMGTVAIDVAAVRRVAVELEKECVRLESDDASAVELSWHEAMAAELRRALGDK